MSAPGLTRVAARLVLAAALLPLLGMVAPLPHAAAAARVTVANPAGAPVIDGTYSTTLTVRGQGFQSIRNGHGGIYVWFGTVSGRWKPSQGGVSGSNYLYVPDSEARDNQGFQRYVAFPGSDTAGAANGGAMSGSGGWSTTLVVPGPTFRAVGRDGSIRTVDCRRVRCGIITVGAHGVKNARNETFTPVRVGDLQAGASPSATASPADPQPPASDAAAPEAPDVTDEPSVIGSGDEPTAPAGTGDIPAGVPTLEVDRLSARAGHVLSFAASGLTPGQQVSVTLDDGLAAAGPFVVGPAGQLAGVLTLPPDIGGGTHELRLFGVEDPPSVRFAVAAETAIEPAAVGSESERTAAIAFTAVAALLLLVALGRLARRARGVRRAS